MSLSVQVTPTGITAPDYATVLASLRASFQGIYGSDAYIAPDSQDGQFLAVLALAISDANDAAIAVYNSFSPSTAQRAALSSNVKINGIARLTPSYSTAVGDVEGVVGTTITSGIVKDQNGNMWDLPAEVIIPISGTATVTVTAQELGAIVAPSGSIDSIVTPFFGWQSFTSTSASTTGAPVESDADLRRRQTVSTALAAVTPLGAMVGVLSNLDGVTELKVYENYTNATDANGLPAKSFSVVIEGGDVDAIAEIIGTKKTVGAATYGTTSGSYVDPVTAIPYTINFFVLASSTVKVAVTGTAKAGYSSTSAALIKTAVADYINSLAIGEDVELTRVWTPAYLNGSAINKTFELTGITLALGAGSPAAADVAIDFNKVAACLAASDVTVTIS